MNEYLYGKKKINPEGMGTVIFMEDGKEKKKRMQWGFPNHWGRGAIYAGKAETAARRSTFSKSVRQRRCLIPTNGYFENVTEGSQEGKYLMRLPGSSNEVYIAGVYNTYKNDEKGGKEEYYYAMLTTPASESVEEFNDRMPVVLRKAERKKWLEGNYQELYDRCDVKLRHTRYS